MTFCLKTIIIKPENDIPIKNAIILLHGYGGDGKDISMLSLNWKRFLTDTVFLCPDAHERCSVNPNGFQWFDLNKEDPQYILEQSIKAEEKLHQFIDEIKGSAREGKGYEIACAQLCGNSHYRMRGFVTVETEEEFNAWLEEEAEYLEEEDEDDDFVIPERE